MNILITGGAGYIGTELTHQLSLLEEVDKIVIYDNLSRKNYNIFLMEQHLPDSKIRFESADILDSYKLNKAVEEADVIFHLAAKVTTPFANEDPHVFEQVNHWGTAELSYAIESNPVKKVIYLSSMSVYGSSEEPVDISTAPRPGTYYGISKLNGEKMLERLFSKTNMLILRCGNVYGYSRSMRFDAVINKFMFGAHFQNFIQIEGGGEQTRPFIHIDKIVSCLVHALKKDIASGTYNLFDKNFSINEIVNEIKNIYPTIDTLHTLKDVKLRSLSAARDPSIGNKVKFDSKDLITELRDFSQKFSFLP
ncbi:NAD-dependent epimerase/dehydratase family protein [Chondrinema litorale]|uniref:NAD-dependent epimerase/dehydratase family protein n=1 Tax=Chondrinema litorale TaxID=2994555 RepID=UPI002543CF04|nr:SDR family oxidoreductase [Chondrinema litorale]UZR94008.1 SDR family oxidoreductase [Chondrinema litorale]